MGGLGMWAALVLTWWFKDFLPLKHFAIGLLCVCIHMCKHRAVFLFVLKTSKKKALPPPIPHTPSSAPGRRRRVHAQPVT